MATPRELSRPPIIEALVDVRAAFAAPQSKFEEFAKDLNREFPKTQVKRGIKAELKVEGGKLIPPKAELLGFQGIRVSSADETLQAQFRLDGFTLNNLKQYVGGERLISEALRLWARATAELQPQSISRIAFRYINHLDLPFRDGDDFTEFLTSPPPIPDELPQATSEFLSRLVTHPSPDTILIFTQRLMRSDVGTPRVVLDIDVSRNSQFAPDTDLRPTLESLRILRNTAFFALLTDKAVNLFV